MTIDLEKMVERQVFLNSKFHTILEVDPPGKNYLGFLSCLHRNIQGNKVTWEDIEDYTPFLEVLILRDISGLFSYKVILTCYDELDKANWRRLRDRVTEILEDFEFQKVGTKGLMFYPEKVDSEEVGEKSDEMVLRMKLSIILKKRYKELQRELSKLLKEGAIPAKIAEHYSLQEQIVKDFLHGTSTGKPTPAELAKRILLALERGARASQKMASLGGSSAVSLTAPSTGKA